MMMLDEVGEGVASDSLQFHGQFAFLTSALKSAISICG